MTRRRALAVRIQLSLLSLSLLVLGACSSDETSEPARSGAQQNQHGELTVDVSNDSDADAEALYLKHCADCHEGGVARAPHRSFIAMLSADAIAQAMSEGIMRSQAAALSSSERELLAAHLADKTIAGESAADVAPRCEGAAAQFDFAKTPLASGWGMDPGNTRFIPDERAQLTAQDTQTLELAWAFVLPNAIRVRSEASIAGGAVHFGSQDGTVYSLDSETGCIRWTFKSTAEVRTPIIFEQWQADNRPTENPRAYFGDLIGRAYAVDAVTGELLWQTRVDDHPNATLTGAPVLHDGVLYVPVSSLEEAAAGAPDYPCCSFRGSLVALDANTGEQLWKSYTIKQAATEQGKTPAGTPILAPSGAAVWNSPSLDPENGRLYLATGDNYSTPADGSSDAIHALDLNTGETLWAKQKMTGDAWNVACMLEDKRNCPEGAGPDFDFGASTVLAQLADGRKVVFAGQKSGAVYALDAQSGEELWRSKIGRGGIQAGVQFGLAYHKGKIFVPISDMEDGEKYEEAAKPGIYALDAATGETLWSKPAPDACRGREFCDSGIAGGITLTPGLVWAGHMDGMLRAYSQDSGDIVWEYDTSGEVMGTAGIKGQGGSIAGTDGPVIADGMVFVGSGYGVYFHMPGNVLLAFRKN